jgi:hypothetical protein
VTEQCCKVHHFQLNETSISDSSLIASILPQLNKCTFAMNLFNFTKKRDKDDRGHVYDVMSDPGFSSPSSRVAPRRPRPSQNHNDANTNSNATHLGSGQRISRGLGGRTLSTKGYQDAIDHFNKTVDPNASQRSVPIASNLFVNSAMRTVPITATGTAAERRTGNGVTQSQRTSPPKYSQHHNRHNSGNSDEYDVESQRQNTLSYSQSLDSNSSSPEKSRQHLHPYALPQAKPHAQPQNTHIPITNMTPQPQSQISDQTKTTKKHSMEGPSSSSTFDDYSSNDDDGEPDPSSPSSSYSFPIYPGSPSLSLKYRHSAKHKQNGNPAPEPEPEMVDATYAEHYGDAYTGKPLRYIYPKGYGSMRPRSRPWQIALILFLTFAWLNVFIVGHCSDRYNAQNEQNNNDDGQNNNNQNQNQNNYYYYNQQIDDDAQKIEAKWCGSRPLYFMWVLSVASTGITCAYCSIIGYVKARDFAIANGRSQPPGMAGKSDYYVQIEEDLREHLRKYKNGKSAASRGGKGSAGGYQSYQDANQGGTNQSGSGGNGGNDKTLKKVIYQADGTPRYLGGQIYKPTQAAVNITSR